MLPAMSGTSAKRTALITGASAGLGRDFATLFAADGYDVVLVARRKQRLEQIKQELESTFSITATVLPADLTDPASPQAIFDATNDAGLAVDFLVNNAGFGSNGPFVDQDAQREVDMVSVNVSSLVHLTGLFAPQMVDRGFGRILNIGSMAGFQAGPYMATYYASKAFVNHFSEALSHELAGTGVTVTVSCPGPTTTEFGAIAGNDKAKMFKGRPATSEQVARDAYKGMLKGNRMVVHGLKNKFLLQTLRMTPRGIVHKISARLNKP